MANNNISSDTRKFFSGITLGLILGCGIGFMIGETRISSPTNNQTTNSTELSTEIIIPTNTEKQPSTPTDMSFATLTPVSLPAFIVTSTPSTLNIPYTQCGDHIAYSASTEIIKIPLIENDIIIENADYVIVTYKIKNTYTNTPIYGFEIRLFPSYDNPDLYPDTLFNSKSPFQPNEEVILKSEHLFVPEDWDSVKHQNVYWKFPEDISFHPRPYERIVGGYVILFQIVEQLGVFADNEEVECDGAIKIK